MIVKYQEIITPNYIERYKTPIYKKVTEELMHIPININGYDYYQGEISKNADKKYMEVDCKFFNS